jgi:DNA polymerase-3 subunit alpha
MDRMISISQQAHGAAEQYTMFDMPAFASAARLANDLPEVLDVSRREVLSWEKELVGAYISDHPLSRVWADLENTITVLTGQIDETLAGKSVTVAGLVNYVRPHTTRSGKAMAFGQIEDLQGTLEIVIFPRVWQETRELWQAERILVLRGKVSFRGREPSLIVDSATTEILTTHPREPESFPSSMPEDCVHLHIVIPRNPDLEQVTRRLGQIYDLLQSYPGEDHFSLYVENGGMGQVLIAFPNDTTGHCAELEQLLRNLLNGGTVRIERVRSDGP